MKKVLLPLLVVLFTACVPSLNLPSPWSKFTMADYSMFTQNEIFVTESNSVSFDYTPIGSVHSQAVGGWVKRDGKDTPIVPKDDDYYINSKARKKMYKSPQLQDAFNTLIENMKSIGANGIINLRIIYDTPNPNIDFKPETIMVTGMAIKR